MVVVVPGCVVVVSPATAVVVCVEDAVVCVPPEEAVVVAPEVCPEEFAAEQPTKQRQEITRTSINRFTIFPSAIYYLFYSNIYFQKRVVFPNRFLLIFLINYSKLNLRGDKQ